MTEGEIKGIATEIVKSVLSYQLGRKIIPEIPPQKTLVEIHARISNILTPRLDGEIDLDLSDVMDAARKVDTQATMDELDEAKAILDHGIQAIYSDSEVAKSRLKTKPV